jgi:branched-chain amino acid transport system substrate-binding protein
LRAKGRDLLLVVGVVAVMCVVVIAGCPPKGGSTGETGVSSKTNAMSATGGAQPEAAAGEKIKIGAIFSVTGPMAPLGEPEKNAAELIAGEVNAAGGVAGKQIELIVKDDKSETTDAALAAKDLIETEKVCAIVGPSGTPTTLAIADICQNAKVPLLSCAAGNAITNPIRSFVFSVPPTDVLAVSKILDYLQAQKIKSVAVIYVATPYGESGNKQLKEQLGKAGIKITTAESFGPKDTTMTGQLTKIKGTSPDAVICWGTNPGPASVARDMKKLGMTMPLIQSHGVANAKFIELAGEAAEGVQLPAGRILVWQSIPDSNKQKAVLSEFASAYKTKYTKDADTFAGHAYDSLHILLNAIEAAGGTDPDKLREAIEKTKEFVGTAGLFTYSPTDHNGLTKDAFVWVKIEKGAWKLAE